MFFQHSKAVCRVFVVEHVKKRGSSFGDCAARVFKLIHKENELGSYKPLVDSRSRLASDFFKKGHNHTQLLLGSLAELFKIFKEEWVQN